MYPFPHKYRRGVALQPVEAKQSCRQMPMKSPYQPREIRVDVIVTDGIAGAFPDMLLWIELRTTWRKVERLHTGMGRQKVTDGLSFVPARTIQQDEQRAVGVAGLHMLKKVDGHGAGLLG